MTTIIDEIKSLFGSTQKVHSEGTHLFVEEVKSLYESGKLAGIELDTLGKKYKDLDKNVLKTAKSIQANGESIEKLDGALGAAGTASQEFGEAVKSAVINMGAMLLVMVAIKGAMWIFDKLNVTTEEQQEIVDDLTEKVKGLKDEYNELYGRNDLTEAEKQKLDYLQRQLTVNEQILKQEQKKLGTVIFLMGQFVSFEF